MKSVAITGATGLLGGCFCESFAADGWRVRALVRSPGDFTARHEAIETYRCDLPDDVDPQALAGADVLVHCAWPTRERDPAAVHRGGEEGTRTLRRLAHEQGVERFVFLSSTSAGPRARSQYGRSKHALELELDATRDLVLRPGLVLSRAETGLFHRLCRSLSRSPVLPVVGGRRIVQTVHVDDLFRALRTALEEGVTGEITVAEPDGLTFEDLLSEIASRLGRRCLPIRLHEGLVLGALRAVEALHIPAPVSSDNLLGLTSLEARPADAVVRALGVHVRSATESLDDILGPPQRPVAGSRNP